MNMSDTHPNPVASTRFSGITFAVAQFSRKLLYQVQLGRMMQVLSHLSDDDLAEIGITRSDIPKYAAQLLKED